MRGKSIASSLDFEELVREHQRSLRAYAFSFVREAHAADDIVQETLIRAWRYLPTFRGEGSLQGWLMRICGNVARTYLRKRHVHEPILSEDEVPSPVDASSHSDLMSLITKLTVEHRTVVTLCLVLGFTYEEAADILEVPIGTVRSRLFRARENLAQEMTDIDGSRVMAV